MHYVGIDLGSKSSAVAIMDERGQLLEQREVVTDTGELDKVIQPFSPVLAVVESSPLAEWACQALEQAGHEVQIIDARAAADERAQENGQARCAYAGSACPFGVVPAGASQKRAQGELRRSHHEMAPWEVEGELARSAKRGRPGSALANVGGVLPTGSRAHGALLHYQPPRRSEPLLAIWQGRLAVSSLNASRLCPSRLRERHYQFSAASRAPSTSQR